MGNEKVRKRVTKKDADRERAQKGDKASPFDETLRRLLKTKPMPRKTKAKKG